MLNIYLSFKKRNAGLDWNRLKAVIFDVDGTLYSQSKLRKKILIDLLTYFSLRPWRLQEAAILHHFRKERERRAGYQGGDLENAQYSWCAEKAKQPVSLVKSVVDQWMFSHPNQYLPDCVYPGVKEFFSTLQARGTKVAVYSDYKAQDKLQSMGLEADLILSSTDPEVDRLKPDPKGLLLAAERLGVKVEECLFIGDRQEMDGECALRAEMPYLIVNKKPFDEFDFFKNLISNISSNYTLQDHGSHIYSSRS